MLERLPLLGARPASACVIAFALSFTALLMRWALDDILPPGFPFLTFFPAVIVAAFLFGRGPGTLAATLCGILSWYYFVPPFHSFGLGKGTATAMLFYVGVVAVDITLVHWMQQANARLRDERERSQALAARTELLFNELQHRVANNLQMAGAVLSLQKRTVTDEGARRAIEEAGRKLQLIGRIQRQLYNTQGEQANVDVFLNQLVADLIDAGGKPGITWSVDAERGLTLDPTALIPVALILAEAVANAIEHGFADRERGHLSVRAHRVDGELRLDVADDGAGLPTGFDFAGTDSLGLKIARTLARQLQAGFTLTGSPVGTTTSLALPFPDPA